MIDVNENVNCLEKEMLLGRKLTRRDSTLSGFVPSFSRIHCVGNDSRFCRKNTETSVGFRKGKRMGKLLRELELGNLERYEMKVRADIR